VILSGIRPLSYCFKVGGFSESNPREFKKAEGHSVFFYRVLNGFVLDQLLSYYIVT